MSLGIRSTRDTLPLVVTRERFGFRVPQGHQGPASAWYQRATPVELESAGSASPDGLSSVGGHDLYNGKIYHLLRLECSFLIDDDPRQCQEAARFGIVPF